MFPGGPGSKAKHDEVVQGRPKSVWSNLFGRRHDCPRESPGSKASPTKQASITTAALKIAVETKAGSSIAAAAAEIEEFRQVARNKVGELDNAKQRS